MFFFDEILLRLSKSKYCKSFIIKGGLYLQNIVGVEQEVLWILISNILVVSIQMMI